MTASSNPALFDTYNARFLDPKAIARSFILPHSIFGLLCKNENSLLVGPRGSGKTTLMKMLRPSALRAWRHEERQKILRELAFTAVYVASDSGWTGRMSNIDKDSNEYRIYEILQNSTFVTYLMSSMLDAVREATGIGDDDPDDLQRHRLNINSNLEGEIAHELAKRWLLNIEFPSFRALRFGLEDRIQAIDDIFFGIATLRRKVRPAELLDVAEHRFLSLDPLSVMKSFVTTINELCNDPRRTWAFCIDEVEILNTSYERTLRSLRSTSDQRLRFKISASPFSRTMFAEDDSSAPMGGNDFTPIPLTYARKLDGINFGRQMLEALLAEASITRSPQELFGKSKFEPMIPQQTKGKTNLYAKGGDRHKSLTALAETDAGFARYLKRRNIVLDEVSAGTESERAEIRKLIQIAEIRREFGISNVLRHGDRKIMRHRSRKRIGDLYTGAESLLTICDGNPRWLIGLFRPLIELAKTSGNNVVPSRQATSISTTIARYLSLLSTIPFPHEHKELPVTKSLDKIGEYFFSDITDIEFKTEPALSFVIDNKVKDNELEAIGAALNQGAFVFIPSQDTEHCVGSIRNRRFRLSYMLCPRYKLPLMYGQPVILSRILKKDRHDDSQYTLVDLYR